jgi:hypothetical protein
MAGVKRTACTDDTMLEVRGILTDIIDIIDTITKDGESEKSLATLCNERNLKYMRVRNLLLRAQQYRMTEMEQTKIQQPEDVWLPKTPYEKLYDIVFFTGNSERPVIYPEDLAETATYVMNTFLTEREQSVVKLRLGMGDGNDVYAHTLVEVGEVYGITRSRVREIEARAYRKLRIADRAEILKLGLKAYNTKQELDVMKRKIKKEEEEKTLELERLSEALPCMVKNAQDATKRTLRQEIYRRMYAFSDAAELVSTKYSCTKSQVRGITNNDIVNAVCVINVLHESLLNNHVTDIKSTTFHVLKRATIHCGGLDVVIQKTNEELMKLRSFGRKSVIVFTNWANDFLADYNLTREKFLMIVHLPEFQSLYDIASPVVSCGYSCLKCFNNRYCAESDDRLVRQKFGHDDEY